MAKRNKVKRAFRSGRTDMRKKGKPRIVGARAKRNPSDYKPPTINGGPIPSGFTRGTKQRGIGKELRRMRESTVRCQTLVGAKMVWAGAKDKNGNKIVRNGKVVRYPTIIIPDENPDGHRCDNPSVVSKRRNGVTEHKCASHVGTWYVDVDGRRHNFDNELLD